MKLHLYFLMCYTVYIIYSKSSDTYYKGQTKDIFDRLSRHNNGQEKASRHGLPWKLLWSCEKPDRSSAIILEKKLKNLSRDRLIEFILKHPEGVAGPDALTAKRVRDQDADTLT
jgi:putative endonuclease